jgi:hypothetical protein
VGENYALGRSRAVRVHLAIDAADHHERLTIVWAAASDLLPKRVRIAPNRALSGSAPGLGKDLPTRESVI